MRAVSEQCCLYVIFTHTVTMEIQCECDVLPFITGRQAVLPVWYGGWGVSEDGGAQLVPVYFGYEVPTIDMANLSSVSTC